MEYPEPIPLPTEVFEARSKRKREVMRITIWGILVRFSIVVFELIGVFMFGSAALLMDALATSLDVMSSLFLILCVRLASKPPDEDHPFGHGRYEPLGGLQIALFMIFVGLGMTVYQTIMVAQEPFGEQINPLVWVIPFTATVLLEVVYQFMKRVAKKESSTALSSEAVHFRIDGVTSLLATIALFIGVYFPFYSHAFDHLGAIFIAVFMTALGINAARQNIAQLMDRVPKQRYFDLVRNASMNVTGVLDTEKIRIQCYGPDAHVDIDVEVDPNMSVDDAHKISQNVRAEIQKDWPQVRDVTVHIEPFYPGDH